MAVQADAYDSITPESLATLKSKWVVSPRTCFAFEEAGEITAYLLAHAWNSTQAPKLYEPLPINTDGDILFLHDLALMKKCTGKGIGTQMVDHLLARTQTQQFTKILLVAVQSSTAFWSRFGFSPQDNTPANELYGSDAIVMVKTLNR